MGRSILKGEGKVSGDNKIYPRRLEYEVKKGRVRLRLSLRRGNESIIETVPTITDHTGMKKLVLVNQECKELGIRSELG